MAAPALPTTPSTAIPWRFILIMLVSAFVGAWAGILGRLAQGEGVPTAYIIAFRQVAGAIALTPFVWGYHRAALQNVTRRDLFFVGMAGFWFSVHLLAGFTSLEHTTVLISNILAGTSPLWIALIEVFYLKNRLGQMVWVGLALTMGGGVIIALSGGSGVGAGDNPTLGSVLSIGASLAGALYAILGRQSRARIGFIPYMWLLFVFGGLTAVAYALLTGVPFTGYSANGYIYLILLVLLAQLIGHTTYNYVLRHIPATYTSMMGQVGMVLGGVIALFLFHEIPSALQLPGSLLILGGIALVNVGQSRP